MLALEEVIKRHSELQKGEFWGRWKGYMTLEHCQKIRTPK